MGGESATGGGNTTTGGTLDEGGAASNGGTSGDTGGSLSTGGVASGAPAGGTGGKGSGATGGTAGNTGTSGGAATGGAATGGKPSSGGSTGGSNCVAMRTELSALLTEAQACNLSANAQQCTGFVDSECNCPVPVNSPKSDATQAYVDAVAVYKKACSPICAAVLCVKPTYATCSRLGTQSGGHCVSGGITTGPGGPGP
jgi:hypothetical protein